MSALAIWCTLAFVVGILYAVHGLFETLFSALLDDEEGD